MIDDLKKTSIKISECYALDELIHREVLDAVSQEADLPADGTCQEGFSAACPAINENILCSVDTLLSSFYDSVNVFINHYAFDKMSVSRNVILMAN